MTILSVLLACVPEAGAVLFKKGADWRPISTGEMELDGPRIEAEAGAEILLADIAIDDSNRNATIYRYYYRIKVYDRKGVEELDRIDLHYLRGRGNSVHDVAARVVRPDGIIRELEQGDLYEREVIRYGDYREHVKSFAFPGLEPGCIVEYQWQVTIFGGSANGLRVCLQDRFPSHLVRLRIKPYRQVQSHMVHGNTGGAQIVQDGAGYHLLELRHVRSFERASYPPPRDVIEPWFRLTYTRDQDLQNPEAFWLALASRLHESGRKHTSPNHNRVRAAAKEALTGGAGSDEEKLRALFRYTRARIANLSYAGHGYTPEELDKMKPNESAGDTLGRGYGYAYDVNAAFAALAAAAGYEVRLAAVGDRARDFFNRDARHHELLPDILAAVRVGDAWRLYDPGYPYVSCGELHWSNTDGMALLANPRQLHFMATPETRAADNRIVNRATLRLAADGTLSGELQSEYHGQAAVRLRHQYADLSPAKLGERVAGDLRNRLPRAVVGDVTMANQHDPEQPAVIRCQIEVAGYADAAGTRLFFNPSVFRHNATSLFPQERRACSIYFRWPWQEEDEVSITLPGGYAPERGDPPRGLRGGRNFSHELTIDTRGEDRIELRRKLMVDVVQAPAGEYRAVKAFFDGLATADGHLLTLRQTDAAGGSQQDSVRH